MSDSLQPIYAYRAPAITVTFPDCEFATNTRWVIGSAATAYGATALCGGTGRFAVPKNKFFV